MRWLFLTLIFIFLILNVSALCKEGQININTATAGELDKIVYIGSARAQQIIALRPFSSVDDLVRVSGIGEVYLNAIKAQGLACVDGIEEDDEDNETFNETASEDEVNDSGQNQSDIHAPKERETIVLSPLNPQVIKTEEDKKGISKNYAIYGFVAFCILIGILFIIKNRKNKNEFR